ncbi:MAG: hypothetical protein C4329_10715 [Chitinophagaceae bacterium]
MSSKKAKRQRSIAIETDFPKKPITKSKGATQQKDYSSLWVGLFLFLLVFVLYGASVNYGYILDDEMVITKNGFV